MTLPSSAGDVRSDHVVFELESIDRMYLKICMCRSCSRWRGAGVHLRPPGAADHVDLGDRPNEPGLHGAAGRLR
jgi:hypothetical protein